MSEQWEKMELGKVCEIVLGQSPSSDTYNQDRIGLPFFQGKSEFGSKYAQAKIWCSDPVKTAKMNDILLSVRAPVGESNLAPNICCIGRGIAALRADQEKLLQEFLWHQIDFKKVYLQRISQGSTFDAISGKDLSELEIELPPLPEQKKIAEILSGIDNTIQRLLEAIGLHERARNALMESIFQDGYQMAKSGSDEWQTWTIEELLANTPTPMRSGPFGSALLKEELAEAGIPFLGIDNVKTEEFVPSFKRFLGNSKFNELRRYEVFPHDVMITIMGTVGRSCVVPEGTGQCVSSKHIWTMTFDCKKVSPEIICWQLNYFSRTRKKFLESSQGGVMDAISSQTLREIEVPIPANKEYAKKLAEQYLSSRRYQQALKAKLAKIRLLKSAVTSNLLSGRKRVTV